jgi:general secretion pathway protein F
MMTLLTPALTLIIAGLIGAFIFTVMSAILSINELAVQ